MTTKKNKVILFYGKFSEPQEFGYIPWSMLYLAAVLRTHKIETIIIDEFVTSNDRIEAILKEHADDAILFGISAMTSLQISKGLTAVDVFRRYNKTAPVAIGGAHATATPQQTLAHEAIDYVFVGQSFVSLPNLVRRLQADPSVPRKTIIKSENPDKNDMANFPDFHFDEYDFTPYLNPKTGLMTYSSSVGCPASCSFCSWGGPHTRLSFTLERVVNDIEYLVKRYKVTTIDIQDATFFTHKQFVLSFAEEMLRRQLGCYWRANSRLAEIYHFDRSELSLLAKSGLDWVFIGVETTLPRIMKLFNKNYSTAHLEEVLERSRDLGFIIYMSVILGAPSQTVEELIQEKGRIEGWMQKYPNVYCQKCLFTPYPDTPLTGMAMANGYVEPGSLPEWGEHPLFVDTVRHVKEFRPWMGRGNEKNFAEALAGFSPIRSSNGETIKPAGSRVNYTLG